MAGDVKVECCVGDGDAVENEEIRGLQIHGLEEMHKNMRKKSTVKISQDGKEGFNTERELLGRKR